MGYTTDFSGKFNFDKPLDAETYLKLKDFVDEGHVGPEFPTYSRYCQWTPTKDRLSLEWDGGEKFYEYEKWLAYLIETFIKPAGYVLNGRVKWQGEEMDDRGILGVTDNVLVARKFSEPDDKAISVWRFEDAPKHFQMESTNGGDEDWLVFVPADLVGGFLMCGPPTWIDAMDSMREPQQIKTKQGDVIFIGSHA